MDTNRIEKSVVFQAPRSRVWRAITRAEEFGSWFGMKLNGPFRAGETIHGVIAPTTVDPAVAKMQEPYAGTKTELFVESIEPETRFRLRWHPYAVDPKQDYSKEPTTLITFLLEELGPHETRLTITEEGFDEIPLARRAEARESNEGGWAHQAILLGKYLAREK